MGKILSLLGGIASMKQGVRRIIIENQFLKHSRQVMDFAVAIIAELFGNNFFKQSQTTTLAFHHHCSAILTKINRHKLKTSSQESQPPTV